jgi:hypothetical protein
LDLTYNKLYGEFPRFLVNQAADLTDSCLCSTNFTVSAGNQIYCPTKSSLQGVAITPNLLDTFKQANYTCLLPKQTEPVSLKAKSNGMTMTVQQPGWQCVWRQQQEGKTVVALHDALI